MNFPNEIWSTIKSFQLDYKKYHSIKYKPIIEIFINMFKVKYQRWILLPNHIENNNYVSKSDLHLTTISYNNPGNGKKGWWCGYGWMRNKKKLKL